MLVFNLSIWFGVRTFIFVFYVCDCCNCIFYLKCTCIFLHEMLPLHTFKRTSWSCSYGSWIYNYLCNQCLSPLKLWVQTPFTERWLDTTLCDKVCQWLAEGWWFSPGTPVSSTNKTDHQDIIESGIKHHKPNQIVFVIIFSSMESKSYILALSAAWWI